MYFIEAISAKKIKWIIPEIILLFLVEKSE
jgi:hypothetical protein